MMLPTSCEQTRQESGGANARPCPSLLPTCPSPPRPPQREIGHLNSNWVARPYLALPPHPILPPALAKSQQRPLTFPCISIRSVRVMLSSGSSSSPASELLILSGGAGATAAWGCVHAAARLALAGTAAE